MSSVDPPKLSWTRRLDEADPPPSTHTFSRPAFLDALSLLPLAYRMGQYISNERKNFREPIFDLSGISLEPPKPGPYAGVPCGGLGGGCVGRGYRGDFRRWSIFPGRYAHRIVYTDQFSLRVKRLGTNKIYATVLSVVKPAQDDMHLPCRFWNWNMNPSCATYHATFPRAWTVYEEPVPGVRVIIRQVSPFIPHNYSDSSLPVCLFHVDVENIGSDDIEASVMFTFQNGDGGDGDSVGGFVHCPYSLATEPPHRESIYGVLMTHHHIATKDCGFDQGSFAIATQTNGEVSFCKQFVCEKPTSVKLNTDGQPEDVTQGDTITQAEAQGNGETFLSSFFTNIKTVIDQNMFGSEGDVYTGTEEADLLWKAFYETGHAPSFFTDHPNHTTVLGDDGTDPDAPSRPSMRGYKVASALCVSLGVLAPQELKSTCFSLAWDHPIVRFGSKRFSTTSVPRYYTRFFGTSGLQAFHIASYALLHRDNWEDSIMNWQDKLIRELKASNSYPFEDGDANSYFQYHIFNELYFLVDGGSIWTNSSNGQANSTDELFKSFIAGWSYDEKSMITAANHPLFKEGLPAPPFGMHEVYNSNDLSELFAGRKGSMSKIHSSDDSHEYRGNGGFNAMADLEDGLPIPAADERMVLSLQSVSMTILSCLSLYMQQHNQILQYSNGHQDQIGQFLYYEGHEYLMYNTYDVHFYASFALLQLFPQIELSIQRDFAAAVVFEDNTERVMIGEGHRAPRKVKSVVPHDLGSPTDVSNWKDLGPKFILQIFRDYKYIANKLYADHLEDDKNNDDVSPSADATEKDDANPYLPVLKKKDKAAASEAIQAAALDFLKEMYPICEMIMNYCLKFDTNHDGMIENSGFPDQTYDIWIATGVHAYCGGLWVAACTAMSEITELIVNYNKHLVIGDNYDYYHILASKASYIYITKLWNGRYFNYDSSTSEHHDSIMADMLAGQWYSHACGLSSMVVSSDMAYSCLETIYETNVIKFGQGKLLGAVNGMRPSALKASFPKQNFYIPSYDSDAKSETETVPSSDNGSGLWSMPQTNIWNIFQQPTDSSNNGQHSSASGQTNNPSNSRSGSADVDNCCLQSKEVWTGTTYALAALMLHEASFLQRELNKQQQHNIRDEKKQDDIRKRIVKLRKMAYTTARGIHDAGWKEFGYWFATPEAWEQNGNYRSLGYMRPLAIWAMQLANAMDD